MVYYLESYSGSDIDHAGGEHKNGIEVSEGVHTTEIDGPEPLVVVGADTEDSEVDSCTDNGLASQTVFFGTAIDTHTAAKTGIEVDVLMVVIGETNRRHDHEVVEIMPFLAAYHCSFSVTRHVCPVHKTDIYHTTVREPAFGAVLVLQPYMLVMVVILMIHPSVTLRHGPHTIRGIMPDQALKQLVTPTDTHLMVPVQVGPFTLCKSP